MSYPAREIPVEPDRLARLKLPEWYVAATAPSEVSEEQETQDSEARRALYESVRHLLDRLPPYEADLIDLYYLLGKDQADIAEMFACTQYAISYRLKRARQRLRFLVSRPDVAEADFRNTLGVVLDAAGVDALWTFYRTASWSRTAREHGYPYSYRGRGKYRMRLIAEWIAAHPDHASVEIAGKIHMALTMTDRNVGILSDARATIDRRLADERDHRGGS